MNFLTVCLEDFKDLRLPEPDFRVQVCGRCKNAKCEYSRWSTDPMAERVATQMDRFFKAEQADPRSSRYEHLTDFRELRSDWVPVEVSTGSTSRILLPSKRNTEVPVGGIILGPTGKPAAAAAADPWAGPSKVPNKVEPGARIRMTSVVENKNE